MKRVLKQESNSFSEELYLKGLCIEEMMEAEDIFSNIQKNTEVIMKRNELFWQYISRNEVNLSDILQIVKPNFHLIDTLNEKWAKIGSHFEINRRWKFYYLCFTIYVKN